MADSAPPPETRVSAESYNDVVDVADLVDIKIISSRFDVKPGLFSSDKEDLDFRYGCELEKSHFDSSSNMLAGTFVLEAGCKLARTWVLKLRATYLVAYEVSGQPNQEAATAFVSRVGRFACYPYFRAHFAHLCSEAGAEVPPLPVMKGNLPRRIEAKQ